MGLRFILKLKYKIMFLRYITSIGAISLNNNWTVYNLWLVQKNYPANIYLLEVNNRNTRKRCEICSKLTIKTPERHPFSGE